MPEPEPFVIFTRRLEQLALQYMVSGSIASIYYGEPRLTNDVDIKLQFYKEGGHEKHLRDIQRMLVALGLRDGAFHEGPLGLLARPQRTRAGTLSLAARLTQARPGATNAAWMKQDPAFAKGLRKNVCRFLQ